MILYVYKKGTMGYLLIQGEDEPREHVLVADLKFDDSDIVVTPGTVDKGYKTESVAAELARQGYAVFTPPGQFAIGGACEKAWAFLERDAQVESVTDPIYEEILAKLCPVGMS